MSNFYGSQYGHIAGSSCVADEDCNPGGVYRVWVMYCARRRAIHMRISEYFMLLVSWGVAACISSDRTQVMDSAAKFCLDGL